MDHNESDEADVPKVAQFVADLGPTGGVVTGSMVRWSRLVPEALAEPDDVPVTVAVV